MAAEELKPQVITTENNDYFGYMKDFHGFHCQAKGTNLKYSWRHNDFVINDGYIIKYPEHNASTLQPIVGNIDISYQGYYQCFVTNSIGTIFGRKASVKFTGKRVNFNSVRWAICISFWTSENCTSLFQTMCKKKSDLGLLINSHPY